MPHVAWENCKTVYAYPKTHRPKKGNERIICIGTLGAGGTTGNGFPNGDTIACNGTFVKITNDKTYEPMEYDNDVTSTYHPNGTKYTPKMGYYGSGDNQHNNFIESDSINNWFIKYTTP